jgi:tetratricopeptide (TPR) repeat protein
LTQEVEALNQQVGELYGQGLYKEAISLAQKVLVILKATKGSKPQDTAGALNNLAVLYQANGDYAEAEPLLNQTLTIWKQEVGLYHQKTLRQPERVNEFGTLAGGIYS